MLNFNKKTLKNKTALITGGGGLLGNGQDSYNSSSGDDGGHAFVNGGRGGISNQHGITEGGFGGGGSGGGNPGGGGGGINGGDVYGDPDLPGHGGASYVNLDIAITDDDLPPDFGLSRRNFNGALKVTLLST